MNEKIEKIQDEIIKNLKEQVGLLKNIRKNDKGIMRKQKGIIKNQNEIINLK